MLASEIIVKHLTALRPLCHLGCQVRADITIGIWVVIFKLFRIEHHFVS